MGTRRKPSLEDAGKLVYLTTNRSIDLWDSPETDKKKWIKKAIEIWQEVEKAI